MLKQVKLKLSKMRKADECVVYPVEPTAPTKRFVQGSRLVMIMDIVSGKARINYKTGSIYAASIHLYNHPNIEIVQLSQTDIDAIVAATPRSGDKIGGGVYVAQ